MDTRRAPSIPVPPPLRSNVPGTWAFDTMSGRIRTDILARIFRENVFPPDAVRLLQALDTELANASETRLTPISSDGGPDVSHWNDVILTQALQAGETWLSAPWAVSEFYFYRRVMTAVGYFRQPMDPFASQKLLGLSSSLESIQSLAARTNSAVQQKDKKLETDFLRFTLTSLWGNRMDLSIWPVGSQASSEARGDSQDDMAVIEAGQKFILADDTHALSAYVSRQGRQGRFDIVVDNAGFELFCDLCLADFLVQSGLAQRVHIHLKGHPTFVSDAMAKDVQDTVSFLQEAPEDKQRVTLGNRWASHIESGAWVLVEDLFWAQPSAMWEMPDRVARDLANSILVFVKGDANYRRLLGDSAWPFSTPFSDIVSYFPAPVCALRTLKAEIGCGMSDGVTSRAAADDPTWLVSGKYGVVQFTDPNALTEERRTLS